MHKLEYTPNSTIKAALRQLWLRSRERANAIKRDKYTCQKCGTKQSKAKGKEVFVQVHHTKNQIDNWDKIYKVIREELLCSPDDLITYCNHCHDEKHDKENKND